MTTKSVNMDLNSRSNQDQPSQGQFLPSPFSFKAEDDSATASQPNSSGANAPEGVTKTFEWTNHDDDNDESLFHPLPEDYEAPDPLRRGLRERSSKPATKTSDDFADNEDGEDAEEGASVGSDSDYHDSDGDYTEGNDEMSDGSGDGDARIQRAGFPASPDILASAQTRSDGTTPAMAPVAASQKPKKRSRRARTAQEQSDLRAIAKDKLLKNHIEREMKKRGPDLLPEDITAPIKRTRTSKAQADGEDGRLAQDHRVENVAFVYKQDRYKEITRAGNGTSLNNRRSTTQKQDLRNAITAFGMNKVQCTVTDGEPTYLLEGMKTHLKEWQLPVVAWMASRETGRQPPLGGILADTMGFGKTVMALAACVGNRPSKEAYEKRESATLIIVNSAQLAHQWKMMIQEHIGDELASGVYIYNRGTHRIPVEQLGQCRFVLATYHDVLISYPSSEDEAKLFEKHSHPDPRDPSALVFDQEGYDRDHAMFVDELCRITWFRVILDEAHAIKNNESRTCHSAQHLKSERFWALSGTPLINNSKELFPYLKIIGYAEAQNDKSFAEKCLGNPQFKDKIDALTSLLTYRRTHNDNFLGKKILSLPEMHRGELWIDLTVEERAIYQMITMLYESKGPRAKAAMMLRQRQIVSHLYNLEKLFRGTVSTDQLDAILTHLASIEGRQSALSQIKPQYERPNNPNSDSASSSSIAPGVGRLLGKSTFGGKFNFCGHLNLLMNEKRLKEERCTLCTRGQGEFLAPVALAPCNDIFCAQCLLLWASNMMNIQKAPICNKCKGPYGIPTPIDTLAPADDNRLKAPEKKSGGKKRRNVNDEADNRRPGDDFYGSQPSFDNGDGAFFRKAVLEDKFGNGGVPIPSGKVTAAKEVILGWMAEEPKHKGIIFVQFIATASVVGRMLQLEGIHFVYLHGKMTNRQKIKAVDNFKSNPKISYLVASMRCGGQALNLTCASRVVMIDTWWNEAAEDQAKCRVFRLGQIKETHYVRILARDTIDEYIKNMQGEKTEKIEEVLQDDGHETLIKSEFEMMKTINKEVWLAKVAKLMAEIRRKEAGGGLDAT